MRLTICALLAGMVLPLLAVSGAAEIKVYPAKGELRLYSKAALGPKTKGEFAAFKKGAKYFGAFYYNEPEDVSWYLTTMPSLKDAKSVALSECELASKGKGRCKLYAVLVPKGFPAELGNASGLSLVAAEGYAKEYQPHVKPGAYAAFAQSGLGDYGYSYGYQTADEASEIAQLHCQSALDRNFTTFAANTRKTIKQIGAGTCKVIFRAGP